MAPAEARPRHTYPDRIELPDSFLPEGITIGKAPVAYLGSRADGDIIAADLRTGQLRLVSEGRGPGFPSIGLKIDKQGLLYVAGGPTGTARVVDSRTGDLLAEYTLSTETSFINDVVLTKRAAWFTNSQQPELYRVPRAGTTRQRGPLIPLTGDWEQVAGLQRQRDRPDARTAGLCWWSTPPPASSSGSTRRPGWRPRSISAATSLTNGDGLLVQGRTLYVVQNRLNQVAVVKLNRRRHQGPAGQDADQPGLRRADDGRRVQGQPLPAQRPVRRPGSPGACGVLDHPDRQVAGPYARNCSRLQGLRSADLQFVDAVPKGQ